MKTKAITGILLIMFLTITLSITFREVSAMETQGVTILEITNPNSSTVSGSIVYWTFEIIGPDKEAVPGEIVQYSIRVTNLPASDIPLQFDGIWVSFDPGLSPVYGNWYFNFEWPTVSIGETYEGPFGFFIWTNNVPIGYVQGGFIGAGVNYGSPESQDAPYTVTIVSPAIPASVDIDPDKLNLKRQRKGWVTVYISPPEGYSTADIVVETVKLEIEGAFFPMVWFDIKPPKRSIFTAKFDKSDIVNYLQTLFHGHGRGFIEFKITGKLVDDTPFEGINIIQLIF